MTHISSYFAIRFEEPNLGQFYVKNIPEPDVMEPESQNRSDRIEIILEAMQSYCGIRSFDRRGAQP